MAYRRTTKYTQQRESLQNARRARDRARMEHPAPDYPLPLPEVRIRITVERFDPCASGTHVFELRRTRRVDQFAVVVDGRPWKVSGLSGVLEGIRKATPRVLSERAI